MNSTKVSLLSNLHAAKYWQSKNGEIAKLFHQNALNVFQSNIPSIKSEVQNLINDGYITNNGTLTFKGELTLVNDPNLYSNTHLSITTKKHLELSIKKDILRTHAGTKGCLSFLTIEELKSLLGDILDTVFDKVVSGECKALDLVNESSAAFMVELSDSIEKELLVFSPDSEVVDMVTETVLQEEQVIEQVKPKTTRKKKEKVA